MINTENNLLKAILRLSQANKTAPYEKEQYDPLIADAVACLRRYASEVENRDSVGTGTVKDILEAARFLTSPA
jgi:hypothetical protein